ncbi:hypothetical protein COU57_00965 [Candidatus Pacearchaeota archaeon CG10_big_fil_rev_8_21_14_0_10_32_14]|nr:MAG: hypothetical protein COU57_00965 [Candidatus Pacearchaeota archaeon CG10_big_fil_rev_8_21_14_0_10_32_14]
MDLSDRLYDSIKRVGKSAGKYATIGALALGASLYSSPARAVTLDSDLDGLADAYEVSIGTATDDNDFDDDGFYDGIEDANRSLNGDPIDSNNPFYSSNNVIYDFTKVKESVNQNDTNHRLMPVFSPVDGLSFGYVVAASPGYTNPRIAIANVGDVSSETFITLEGDLPTPFNFHQLTYNSDGSTILYDDGKDIFEALVNGGGIAQKTIMDSTSSVYNPEVVKINGLDYIVSGFTDSDTKSLVGWLYTSSPINENEVITVVNLDDNFLGQENFPRVSNNGDTFSYNVRDKFNSQVSKNYVAKGLTNILEEVTSPILLTDSSEPRNNLSSFYNGNNMTGNIGMIGNFLLQMGDKLNNYDTLLPGDFSSSDFEVYASGINNLLDDINRITPSNISVIPFPGNQPFASLDKNGTKLIMCSDFNPYLPYKKEFSLLNMSLGTNVSFIGNDGNVGSTINVIDPSGTKLTFIGGDTISFPVGEPNRIKVSTPQIQNATTNETIRVRRVFEPTGTTFTAGAKRLLGNKSNIGVKITYTYRDEDIVGLNENTLKISYYDASIGSASTIETLVDPVNNTLEGYISHFSETAIKGTPLPGPSAVENWNLYE